MEAHGRHTEERCNQTTRRKASKQRSTTNKENALDSSRAFFLPLTNQSKKHLKSSILSYALINFKAIKGHFKASFFEQINQNHGFSMNHG